MPFSYKSGWLIALALFITLGGCLFALPRADERQRNFFGRYLLIAIGMSLLAYTVYGCAAYDALN
jgi:hypothetical protein